MKRVVLPQPPNPAGMKMVDWQNAVFRWMNQVKGAVEDASRVNDTPLGQAFLATNFTTNTVITGTSTGTDVANYLASITAAMTARGMLSPTISRSGTV